MNNVKLNKQEVLDSIAPTTDGWVLQQLLARLSKTEAEQARRILQKLITIAYKSSAKELSFEEWLTVVKDCATLLKDETITNIYGYEMDNR